MWLGDMNYRVNLDYHTAVGLAENDDFDSLLSHDQVSPLYSDSIVCTAQRGCA